MDLLVRLPVQPFLSDGNQSLIDTQNAILTIREENTSGEAFCGCAITGRRAGTRRTANSAWTEALGHGGRPQQY
jgi:hypothetical protein